MLSDILSRL